MADTWPTHPDGRPKRMREMSANEQREQFKLAAKRLAKEFARAGVNVTVGEEQPPARRDK